MTNTAKGKLFFWVTLWGAFLIILGLIGPGLAYRRHGRPPFPVQREQQRKLVRERVVAAGGWDVLRRECESLFTNGSGSFRWVPPQRMVVVAYPTNSPATQYETNIDYGPLPPALASLRPQEIAGYALDDQPQIARIKLFGAHTTGTRGIPYYGLWIVCGPAPEAFTPKLDFGGATDTGEIKKIADAVFEVY